MVIIGGGVIGSSIAYHLSKRNIEVVLLEKGDLASGTSSACGGQIFLQSKKPGAHLTLAMESKKRFETLVEELDADTEYTNHGGLIVVENDKELRVMGLFVEDQKKTGLDVSLLGKDEVREIEPCLSENITAATYSPLDAQINPVYLTLAFIRAAKRLGAKFFLHSTVLSIGSKNHKTWSIRTAQGEIETPVAVNAAGAHAPEIGKMVNLEIPIKPRRGQLLVTKAFSPLLRRCLLSAKYVRAKYDPSLGETEGTGVSIEQTSNGNFLLGSTREFVGYDKGTTWEAMRLIASQTIRILPRLRDLHVIRTFAGLRPYTPDGLPILGKVQGMDGFIMAAGHEGDGIALSPITGEVIADLIVSSRSDFDLSDFRLERFYT